MERKLSALLLVQQQMSKNTESTRVEFDADSSRIRFIIDNRVIYDGCICCKCVIMGPSAGVAYTNCSDTRKEITRLLGLSDGCYVCLTCGHASTMDIEVTKEIIIFTGRYSIPVSDKIGLEIVQRLAPHIVRKN
jgi:hypothetical protein